VVAHHLAKVRVASSNLVIRSGTAGSTRPPTNPDLGRGSLVSGPSAHGQEFVRTDRTDTDAGRSSAQHLQSLIGHKVFINVGVEGTEEVNARVVLGVEDKGVDPEYNPPMPGRTFDHSVLEPPMRAKLATQQQVMQSA
jgi:hypothetical protein